jgi:hypothetical protein
MSIGAYILKQDGDGDTFEALDVDLCCAVTEIRVEQHLDRSATFAIRFQEDFEDGEGKTIIADALRGGKGIAILVESGTQPPKNGPGIPSVGPDDLVCLIRGQVENSQAESSAGGPGSWYEVRGQDLRTLAARESMSQQHTGTVAQIAKVLSQKFTKGRFHPSAETKPVAEFKDGYPFHFNGTRLEALERLSELCDCPVRLEYIVRGAVTVYQIGVDVHFEPSPPRGQDVPIGKELQLTALDNTPWLRILGSEGAPENVINFSLQSDNETYSSVSSEVVNLDGELISTAGETTQTPLSPGQDVNASNTAEDRTAQLTFTGDPDLAAAATRSAANEASWYIKATALTTSHMLGTVLQPHDLVEVIGGGCGLNGVFQVEKVVHVINGASHWMHLDLRSNSSSVPKMQGGLDV